MTMTVGQLKKLLEHVPEDTPFYLYDGNLDFYMPVASSKLRRGRIITDALGLLIDSPVPENPNIGISSVAVIMA